MLCEVVTRDEEVYVKKKSACRRHRKAGRDAVKKNRMETGRGRLRIDKPALNSKQFHFSTIGTGSCHIGLASGPGKDKHRIQSVNCWQSFLTSKSRRLDSCSGTRPKNPNDFLSGKPNGSRERTLRH